MNKKYTLAQNISLVLWLYFQFCSPLYDSNTHMYINSFLFHSFRFEKFLAFSVILSIFFSIRLLVNVYVYAHVFSFPNVLFHYLQLCVCMCVCLLYGPFQGNSHFFKYTKSSLFHLLLIFSIVISVFLFFHGLLLLLLLLQYYSYCCSFVYLWNTPFKVCAQCVIYRIFYIRRDTFSSLFSLSLTTSTFFHPFDFLKGFFTLKFFCMPHLDFCIGLFLPRVG